MRKGIGLLAGLLVVALVGVWALWSALRPPEVGGEGVAPTSAGAEAPQPSAEVASVNGEAMPASVLPEERTVVAVGAGEDIEGVLRARVVDEAGNPLPGTVVRLRRRWSSWNDPAFEVVAQGPQAIAEFPEAKQAFAKRPDRKWLLYPKVLFAEPIEYEIDPLDLPPEPITLVVPTAGSVEVRILDEDGHPFTGQCQVSVELIREEALATHPIDTRPRRRLLSQEVTGDRAWFPVVEVGYPLDVSVRRSGSIVATRVEARGPRWVGDTARVEVWLGCDHPVIQLRPVTEDGTPLVREGFDASIQVGGKGRGTISSKHSYVSTDEGVLRIDLAGTWEEGTTRTLILGREREREDTRPRDERSRGEVDLSRDFAPGLHDLGEVVLRLPPLLVSGRVVTAAGDPRDGSEVSLFTRESDPPGWRKDLDHSRFAGKEGAFEIRGWLRGPGLAIAAEEPGWRCTPTEFTVGDTNRIVVVHGVGCLAGRILVDDWLDLDLLEPQLVPTSVDPDRILWDENWSGIGEEGQLEFRELFPGNYTFTIRVDWNGPVLGEVSDIVVPAGGTTRDPRLDPLDLRGRIHRHRVAVRAADGERVNDGLILHRRAGTRDWADHTGIERSWTQLLSRHERLDLRIMASGMRTREVEGVSGDVEVRMEPGLPVRLVLTGVELPDPPVYLRAFLGYPETKDWFFDPGSVSFDARREALVVAPEPGRIQVQWVVSSVMGGGIMFSMDANLSTPRFVHVADVEEEQTIEVSLTPRELALLIEGGVFDVR